MVAKLRERGATQIEVVDRDRYDLRQLADIRRALAECKPDLIIHLAARVGGIGAFVVEKRQARGGDLRAAHRGVQSVFEVRTMEARLALPVSIEQVAVVIKQMSRSDRERLLDLAPELRQMPPYAARPQEDRGLAMVERMRVEVSRALGGQLLSLSEPFLGDLTLGRYLELPDGERGRLWDAWAEIEPEELAELDVHLDAVLAR